MQVRRFLTAGAFALVAGVAGTASAAPCGGFIDVDDTNPSQQPFCANVEWVKNRSITLGCPGVNLYCPNDLVSRLTMAAFMNRVGTALSPLFFRKRVATALYDFNSVRTLCETDPIALTPPPGGIGAFNRTAIVTALFNAFTPVTGSVELQATIVHSTDGGTTWVPDPNNYGLAFGSLYGGQVPPDDISLRPHNFIDLAPNVSYKFAVQGVKSAGPGGMTNAYCEIHVQIVNRNGTSSPFDSPPLANPHGRDF